MLWYGILVNAAGHPASLQEYIKWPVELITNFNRASKGLKFIVIIEEVLLGLCVFESNFNE